MSSPHKPWVDIASTKGDLARFFAQRSKDLSKFGSTVNQTFEAYLFASTLSHYREKGWEVVVVNPINRDTKKREFRLKFSTRGAPANYSFALCSKDGIVVELRHQLRVTTAHHREGQSHSANVCLDLAVIERGAAEGLGDRQPALNTALVTFGEAKHMNAYAELVAGFVGLVHEMQPERIRRRKVQKHPDHHCPFLFISGYLLTTAKGILETIERRKMDLAIFHLEKRLPGELQRRISRVELEKLPHKTKVRSPLKRAPKWTPASNDNDP